MRALLAGLAFSFAAPAFAAMAAPESPSRPSTRNPPLFNVAAPGKPQRPPLGATLYGGAGGFTDAEKKLKTIKAEGFPLVSLVPTWPYPDFNRIDFTGGPAMDHVEAAVGAALDEGLEVVIKPHLDPPQLTAATENHSWRKGVTWRGYFDVDPMCVDYRQGMVQRLLESLSRVLSSRPQAKPVRLDLGAELMNSITYSAPRWEELLDFAKAERKRLGLQDRVLLSYNFEHHFEIPGDVVARMDSKGKRALARFIKGLDALALSQYMDLTAAMPGEERGKRLPTADEVADALALHERRFIDGVLGRDLGIRPKQVPALHIGEFGVGVGGLRHPNEWAGKLTKEQELALAQEIARGHEGLMRFMARKDGRKALSAVLWTVGPHYDVFGWGDETLAIPAAAEFSRSYLSGR